jgi:hypothetical protein
MQTNNSIFTRFFDRKPAFICQGEIDLFTNISPKQNHKHQHPHRDPLAGWFCITSKDQGKAG